ncbi:alcohol dehydrogenase catalytic domain-containing protein [Chloroflexi bacterium TSY]|nr:alcohol dehydrogenase catalytic domain-containing protein [Chloroflexi bacterium TSY]
MKSLIFKGPRQVEIGEWQEPQITPGQVLIDVAACGICGTDLHVYKGLPATWPVPGVCGHEFSGRVIDWADDVNGFQEGDRVVVQPLVYCGRCRACHAGRTNLCSNMYLIGGEKPGGFAQRVAVPADSLFVLPETLSWQQAAMVETLATPVHAFEKNVSGLLRSVAVFGAGTQGLFAVQLAHLVGAEVIAVSEVLPHRLAIAKELGATNIIDAIQENTVETIQAITAGEGVDLVIEAAGNVMTRQQAIQAVRPGGTVIFLALGAEPVPVDFMTVVPRELQLKGTQCYTDADFSLAIELLASGKITVEPLISTMPLDEGSATFEMLVNDPGDTIKVILDPSPDTPK